MNPGDNWVRGEHPLLQASCATCASATGRCQPTVIGLGLTAIVAACLVVHGFGMKLTGRMDGGAPFEKIRKWDEKHPEKSIGKYDLTPEERQKLAEKDCGHAISLDETRGGQS